MFKVGDKVRVKEGLIPNICYNQVWFNKEMEEYVGRFATITSVTYYGYTIDLDSGDNCWSKEMLEPVKEATTVPTKMVVDSNKVDKFINDRILTYLKKNADYGNSADMSMEMFGAVAYAVRMSDKVNRIESLVGKEAEVDDEKIEDTILDLVNYYVMYASYRTDKPRLLSMIEEFYKLVKDPESYLSGIDVLFRLESDNKLTLKPATLKYIADYIKVLVK